MTTVQWNLVSLVEPGRFRRFAGWSAYFLGVPIWLIGVGCRLLGAPVAQQQSHRQPEPIGSPR